MGYDHLIELIHFVEDEQKRKVAPAARKAANLRARAAKKTAARQRKAKSKRK